MSGNNFLGSNWPPRGWSQLGLITNLKGKAILKDPAKASITGLSYQIDPVPIRLKNNIRSYIYRVTVNGWAYSVQNESREFHVVSFDLAERLTKNLSKEYFISNIKVKSRPLILNKRSAGRAYMTALFLMKQIELGKVPDFNRALRLYKIHPSQRSLYEQDVERTASKHCGLNPYCLETHEFDKTHYPKKF